MPRIRSAFAGAVDELSFVVGPAVVGPLRPRAAGFLYACLAVGSAVSGFAYAWVPGAFRLDTRYVVFSATLVLGMVSPWPLVRILVAGALHDHALRAHRHARAIGQVLTGMLVRAGVPA